MYLFEKTQNWNQFKAKLRVKFPQLSDADLCHEDGKESCMLRMVEYKLRKTKTEMKNIIEEIGYMPIEKKNNIIK